MADVVELSLGLVPPSSEKEPPSPPSCPLGHQLETPREYKLQFYSPSSQFYLPTEGKNSSDRHFSEEQGAIHRVR